jgi:hypothetical protein
MSLVTLPTAVLPVEITNAEEIQKMQELYANILIDKISSVPLKEGIEYVSGVGIVGCFGFGQRVAFFR